MKKLILYLLLLIGYFAQSQSCNSYTFCSPWMNGDLKNIGVAIKQLTVSGGGGGTVVSVTNMVRQSSLDSIKGGLYNGSGNKLANILTDVTGNGALISPIGISVLKENNGHCTQMGYTMGKSVFKDTTVYESVFKSNVAWSVFKNSANRSVFTNTANTSYFELMYSEQQTQTTKINSVISEIQTTNTKLSSTVGNIANSSMYALIITDTDVAVMRSDYETWLSANPTKKVIRVCASWDMSGQPYWLIEYTN